MQRKIKDTVQRWERFMNGVEYNKEKIRYFLPNPFFVGESEWQTEKAAERLCELLRVRDVVEFRQDTQILYYKVGYSTEDMLCYREIRTLTQLLEYHFRAKFKGCLVVDITEWLEHSKNIYFDVLMNYLAQQRDDIFVFFSAKTNKLEKTEAVAIQMRKYFHIDVFDFTKDNLETYKEYAKEVVKEQGYFIKKNAEQELLKGIERLTHTKGFCGFESVKHMAEELVIELTIKDIQERGITETCVKEFFENSSFWKTVKEKATASKIGFQMRE